MTRKALFALLGLQLGTMVVSDMVSVAWLIEQKMVAKHTSGKLVVTPFGVQTILNAQKGIECPRLSVPTTAAA